MQKIEGFDNALFGVAFVWGSDGSRTDVLVYDAEKIRDKIIAQYGLTFEEAREYIEFNIEGAYVGPDTPIIAWKEDLIVMVNDER